MSLLNNELVLINIQFLMLVREYTRTEPIESLWTFDLYEEEVDAIATMSLLEIQEISRKGKAVIAAPDIALLRKVGDSPVEGQAQEDHNTRREVEGDPVASHCP